MSSVMSNMGTSLNKSIAIVTVNNIRLKMLITIILNIILINHSNASETNTLEVSSNRILQECQDNQISITIEKCDLKGNRKLTLSSKTEYCNNYKNQQLPITITLLESNDIDNNRSNSSSNSSIYSKNELIQEFSKINSQCTFSCFEEDTLLSFNITSMKFNCDSCPEFSLNMGENLRYCGKSREYLPYLIEEEIFKTNCFVVNKQFNYNIISNLTLFHEEIDKRKLDENYERYLHSCSNFTTTSFFHGLFSGKINSELLEDYNSSRSSSNLKTNDIVIDTSSVLFYYGTVEYDLYYEQENGDVSMAFNKRTMLMDPANYGNIVEDNSSLLYKISNKIKSVSNSNSEKINDNDRANQTDSNKQESLIRSINPHIQSISMLKEKINNGNNGKFMFYIDGELVLIDDTSNNAFIRARFNLKKGQHKFTWLYTYYQLTLANNNLINNQNKDTRNTNNLVSLINLINKEIVTKRFELRLFEASKSNYAHTDCYLCKKGFISENEMVSRCGSYCHENTYYSNERNQCLKCHNDLFSYRNTDNVSPGKLCLEKPTCSFTDIHIEKSYKINDNQEREFLLDFEYETPKICNDSNEILFLLKKVFNKEFRSNVKDVDVDVNSDSNGDSNNDVNINSNRTSIETNSFSSENINEDYKSYDLYDGVFKYIRFLLREWKQGNVDYCVNGFYWRKEKMACVVCPDTEEKPQECQICSGTQTPIKAISLKNNLLNEFSFINNECVAILAGICHYWGSWRFSNTNTIVSKENNPKDITYVLTKNINLIEEGFMFFNNTIIFNNKKENEYESFLININGINIDYIDSNSTYNNKEQEESVFQYAKNITLSHGNYEIQLIYNRTNSYNNKNFIEINDLIFSGLERGEIIGCLGGNSKDSSKDDIDKENNNDISLDSLSLFSEIFPVIQNPVSINQINKDTIKTKLHQINFSEYEVIPKKKCPLYTTIVETILNNNVKSYYCKLDDYVVNTPYQLLFNTKGIVSTVFNSCYDKSSYIKNNYYDDLYYNIKEEEDLSIDNDIDSDSHNSNLSNTSVNNNKKNTKQILKYLLDEFELVNEICEDDFIGPIKNSQISNQKIFFISINKPSMSDFKDFDIDIIDSKSNIVKPGYVFDLRTKERKEKEINDNKDNANNDKDDNNIEIKRNKKQLVNLGGLIKEVKIIANLKQEQLKQTLNTYLSEFNTNGINNKDFSDINTDKTVTKNKLQDFFSNFGLLIKYSNGDICEENNSKYYETYLFIYCIKNTLINEPIFVGKKECVYYFELYSYHACPNCLLYEMNPLKNTCYAGHRYLYFQETLTCSINTDLEDYLLSNFDKNFNLKLSKSTDKKEQSSNNSKKSNINLKAKDLISSLSYKTDDLADKNNQSKSRHADLIYTLTKHKESLLKPKDLFLDSNLFFYALNLKKLRDSVFMDKQNNAKNQNRNEIISYNSYLEYSREVDLSSYSMSENFDYKEYVDKNIEVIECSEFSEMSLIWKLIIIIVPVLYILFIGGLAVICIKYRRISSEYSVLRSTDVDIRDR